MSRMRIARALALGGVAARRKCEAFILAGEVKLNGEVVLDLGRQVDPQQDKLTFRGKKVTFEESVYYLLNKPVGVTTTVSDRFAKKTVFALLPKQLGRSTALGSQAQTRVFPVGRLDRDSTGALLMTNDGALAQKLLHPRYQVGKWYEVDLNKAVTSQDQKKLLRGIRLEEGLARVEKIQTVSAKRVRLLIREGKKREVRRIFQKLGYQVEALCRIAFGPLRLGSLAPGKGRFLTSAEIRLLKEGSETPEMA